MTFEPYLVAVVFSAFICSGVVKGVVGFGLPAVSLAILAIALDLYTAIALIVIPAFVTNLRQSFAGGELVGVITKTWPFLLSATLAVWLGAMMLASFDSRILTFILGCLLAVYGLISLSGFTITISRQQDRWAGPSLGLVTGLLAGMTGTASVPGILYLRGIGLDKTALIQAMGVLFTLCALVLGIALQRSALLTPQIIWVSTAALIPAFAGMWIGERVRSSMSEQRFKQVFLMSLLCMGLYLAFKSIRHLLLS